jgi:ketosteroid isomerase-like protein
MTDRTEVETLLTKAYAARKRGDLDGVCACFAENPSFVMAGARATSPIALHSLDGPTLRAALNGLINTFEWLDQQILSMIIEGSSAAVHWRGRIRSVLSGEEVVTELVDMITLEGGKIKSFVEFCDTALAAKLMQTDVTWGESAKV